MGFSPSEFFPVIKRVPFRFPCPLNVRLLFISLGLNGNASLNNPVTQVFRETPHFQGVTVQQSVFLPKVLPLCRTRYSPGVSSLYGLLPYKPKQDFSSLPFIRFIMTHYWPITAFQGDPSYKVGFSFLPDCSTRLGLPAILRFCASSQKHYL